MNIKEIMLKRECLYSKYATKDNDSIRINDYIPDIRPNFFRDIDRIIHSNSYTRYMGKTQVFTKYNNDHISKRMIHVQLVSKIARTIGRALSLNEDLIEAAALGHDLGHVPFGHPGETILNEISLKHNEGYFMHNVQSVRLLMYLEDYGLGKNISIQVLDGILCHNGEFEAQKYYPKQKDIKSFLNDYKSCYTVENYGKTLIPMTLEGCVVRISDIIAYLGRDIEDATSLGVFDINTLPSDITNVLGTSNKQIVNNIILDIIKNSLDKPYIELSNKMYNAIVNLKKFNYINIYDKANSKKDLEKIKKMFNTIFNKCFKDLNNETLLTDIHKDFLDHMSDDYINSNSNARKVIDYIAGMTDEYFIHEYRKLK